MKKSNLYSIVILMLSIQICSAQDKQVLHIDSVCNDIKKQIDEGVVLPHTISYVVNRPAIGIQKTTLDFYYNAMSCENYDYNPKTDSVEYMVHPVLYKVVMKYNVAASEFVSKEYYYENEKPVFLISVIKSDYDNSGADSLRVYFDGGKIIKIEKYQNLVISEITSADNDTAKSAINYAEEYLVFFRQMNALEYKQH